MRRYVACKRQGKEYKSMELSSEGVEGFRVRYQKVFLETFNFGVFFPPFDPTTSKDKDAK